MGITERREAEKESIRAKIFDGASRLIIEGGYEMFSIRKLANEIEYSPALIYNYYKNKEELIKAITTYNYHRIFRELSSIKFESMAPKAALERGLLTLSQLLLKYREHFKATLLSGDNNRKEMSTDNDALDLLINILDKGVSSGDFIIDDTKFTAFLLTTGIFGVINMIVMNNMYDKDMINSIINAYVEILVKGVIK